MERLMKGLLEQNPAQDQKQNWLLWVQYMNMLRAQAEEAICSEWIYSEQEKDGLPLMAARSFLILIEFWEEQRNPFWFPMSIIRHLHYTPVQNKL